MSESIIRVGKTRTIHRTAPNDSDDFVVHGDAEIIQQTTTNKKKRRTKKNPGII